MSRIPGHVTPADIAAFWRGRIVGREIIGSAEIDACQVFVGRVHADQVFAGNIEKSGQARADADKHRVIPVF